VRRDKGMTNTIRKTGVSAHTQAWALPVSGASCLIVGFAVLVGWALDINVIKRIVPSFVAMKPNAAIGFVLLGALLFCHSSNRLAQRVVAGFAAFILLSLSAATLAEYVLDCSLGIDELLFRDEDVEPAALHQPGRMSPVAAANFIFLTFAMLLSHCRNSLARWGTRLYILAPLLLSARALVGYLFGVPTLYQLEQCTAIAVHTTSLFAVACIGLFLSRPDSTLLTILFSSGMGSQIARRQLFWIGSLPIGLGLLCLYGEVCGVFGSETGITLLVVGTGTILMVFLVGWCGLVDRVDRQRQLAAESARDLRHASERDPLTGLFNRRGFLEHSEQELARTRRAHGALGCLVLDLDFFKKINDVHGHGAGDEVLRQFAARLHSICRPADVVGRIGGEEFCLLLPDTNESGAKALAERLRCVVSEKPFVAEGVQIDITTSVGVSELHSRDSRIQSLIDRADGALLVAKQTGRNRVFAASSMEEVELTESNCRPLHGLQARDIMTPLGAHVGPNSSVLHATHLLIDLNLDALPVVDGEGKLTGLVTAQDLMAGLLNSREVDSTVGKRMNSVAVFAETVAADEIAKFFCRTAVQRVAVVSEGIPVGVVSRRTVLRWLLNDTMRIRWGWRHNRVDAAQGGLEHSIGELESAVARMGTIRTMGFDHEVANSVIVGEATRIQESLEKLLSSCRPPSSLELVATGACRIL
jgi:diguanylate cyclase (GGDEF)-like protein